MEKSAEELRIGRILRKAAAYLGDCLDVYWPCGDDRGNIREQNIVLHLARAFGETGCATFTQVPFESDSSSGLDMLVIDQNRGVQIVCECKKLNSESDLKKILKDVDRLIKFERPGGSEFLHKSVKIKKNIGLISLLTWKEEYAKWWACDLDENPGDAKEWVKFSKNPKIGKNPSWFVHAITDPGYDEKSSSCAFLLSLLFHIS
jgi:hypothetical protein